MKSDFITLEFENIDRYFNEESLDDNPYSEPTKRMSNDQWTEFLHAYASRQQDAMGRGIGMIPLTNWREEEKLWWNILLSSRCFGSEQHINQFIWELSKFKHNNQLVEILLVGVGRILLNREIRSRDEKHKEEIEKLQKVVHDKEQKTGEARANLQRHDMSGNRT